MLDYWSVTQKLTFRFFTIMLGMSGYTSVFSEKDGVLKSHLNLLYLADSVTNKNFHDGKYHAVNFF